MRSQIIVVLAVTMMVSAHARDTQPEKPIQLAQAQKSCLCDPQRARDVGLLLHASSPINEISQPRRQQFQALVQNNAPLLQPGSPTIVCAARLGQSLQQRGLANFDKQDYDNAYGKVLANGGDVNMAHDVAAGMNAGAVDAWMIGKELVWLSQVLPAAAQGNWQPYWNSGTESRIQLRQVLAIVGGMEGMGELQQMMTAFGPEVEEQLVMAACLF